MTEPEQAYMKLTKRELAKRLIEAETCAGGVVPYDTWYTRKESAEFWRIINANGYLKPADTYDGEIQW